MNNIKFSDFGRIVFNDKYLSSEFSFSKNILLGLNVSLINVFKDEKDKSQIIAIKIDGYFLFCKDGILTLIDKEDDYCLFEITTEGILSRQQYSLKVIDDKLVAEKERNNQLLNYLPISRELHYLSLYGIVKMNKNSQVNHLLKEIFGEYKNNSFYYKKLIKGDNEPWNTNSDDWGIRTVYPLVDLTKENGAMIIIPSSHIFNNENNNTDSSPVEYMYKDRIRCVEAKKGEVIVMVCCLWYKWGKNKTTSHTNLICGNFSKA